MSVYVDDFRSRRPMGPRGVWVFSHMLADTRSELDAMAEEIGLDSKWKQDAGDQKEHYDVTENYRQRAIQAGAIRITVREFTAKILARDLKAYLEG